MGRPPNISGKNKLIVFYLKKIYFNFSEFKRDLSANVLMFAVKYVKKILRMYPMKAG